jgi:hypothetical protein
MSSRGSARYCRFILNIYHNRMHLRTCFDVFASGPLIIRCAQGSFVGNDPPSGRICIAPLCSCGFTLDTRPWSVLRGGQSRSRRQSCWVVWDLTIRKPIGRFDIASRARRGRAGGRPPSPDQQTYKGRNVIEGSFALPNNGAAWPPATANSPSPTAPQPSSAHASPGPALGETRLARRARITAGLLRAVQMHAERGGFPATCTEMTRCQP